VLYTTKRSRWFIAYYTTTICLGKQVFRRSVTGLRAAVGKLLFFCQSPWVPLGKQILPGALPGGDWAKERLDVLLAEVWHIFKFLS
jgi:hypothetical protein